MQKKYRVNILANIYFIWIMTFWNSFFGIWKNIAPYIFIPISAVVTVWCIFRIIKQNVIYRDIGLCWIYLGIISVVTLYKLFNYQYNLPIWGLWIMFMLYCLFLVLRISLYNKNMIKVKKSSERVYHAIGFGTSTYFIIRILFNELKKRRIEDYVAIGVLVMMIGTLILLIMSILGSKFILELDNQDD